eukprot:3578483-Pyramimonas_sp.AAC.1
MAGVRQGCPLSPLLYAICAEFLLDKIQATCPGTLARAYADDTAVVSTNIWADAPKLTALFDDFAAATGLRLNLQKTVVIPLFASPLPTVRAHLDALAPGWSSTQFAHAGTTNLCFYVGPGSRDLLWKGPEANFQQ